MKQLIYGSCALKYWFPESRIPSDIDIISSEHDWISAFEYLLEHNKHNQFVDPDFLYTIKVSHAAWDVRWDKTMKDIAFLRNNRCSLDKDFYDLLYNDWCKVHKDKKVKLSGTNEQFFKPNIKRKFDHDWLHEQLCFYDRPLHERLRRDLSSPLCDKKLFDDLEFSVKIQVAIEEIRVIATERFLLNGERSLMRARYNAIKLLITSMTKDWFNLFLIENIETLMKYEVETWKKQLKNILD